MAPSGRSADRAGAPTEVETAADCSDPGINGRDGSDTWSLSCSRTGLSREGTAATNGSGGNRCVDLDPWILPTSLAVVEPNETLMGVTRPPRVGVVGGVGWGVGLTTITRGYVFAVTLPEAVLVPFSSSMVVVDGGGHCSLTTGTWSGRVSDNAVACARAQDDAGREIDGFEDVHVRDIGVACDVGCAGEELCDADIGVGVVDCSYDVREVCDSAGEAGGSANDIDENMADGRGLGMCRWFGSISTMTRPTQCDLILLASIVFVDSISILVAVVPVFTTSGRAEVNVSGVAAT